MKAKRWILFASAIVFILCVIIFTSWETEQDPIFDGKPLSKHLKSCHADGINLGGSMTGMILDEPIEPRLGTVSVDGAREAILKEGTNAFPMLVRMLSGGYTKMDRWKRPLVKYVRLPQKFLWTNSIAAWLDITQALAAFHTLGSNAAPAAPQIIPLLNDADTALQAIVALMLIHPEREKYILSLTNVARIRRNSQTGATPDLLLSCALLALGSFGPKASNAIPFLINSLSSTNGQVQAAAAVALARIGARAEEVVPLIVNTLPKSDPTPAASALSMWPGWNDSPMPTVMKLWAIEQYGPKAQAALPMLATLEGYRIGNIQDAAKKASAKIKGHDYDPNPKNRFERWRGTPINE